jgi:hypothetical protein
MDISKLSADNLRCVCDFLLEEKLVTSDQILQIISSRPTNEMKRTVDYVHSCLCHDDHDEDCNYLAEEQLEDCWAKPDHRRWLTETSSLMQKYNFSTENEIKESLRRIIAIVTALSKLSPVERDFGRQVLASFGYV